MTTFHQRQRRGFAKGSLAQVYTCRTCQRRTRPTGTGDNDGVGLCAECYELAGEENHLSDTGTTYSTAHNVRATIDAVKARGGDVSHWAELSKHCDAAIALFERGQFD